MRKTFFAIALSGLTSVVGATAFGQALELRNVYSDDMLFQRDQPIVFVGRALAGAEVRVALNGNAASAKAEPGGDWRVELPAMPAGGPYTVEITSGAESLRLKGVMVGELWLASGQSNMEMPVWSDNPLYRLTNGLEVAAAAHDSDLRLFGVPLAVNCSNAQTRVSGKAVWRRGDAAEAVKPFSAVGYLFGKELRRRLGVPVGIISSNWGGTRIEPWISEAVLREHRLEKALGALAKTRAATKSANSCSCQTPTVLHNAMIAPLDVFRCRGAIWYQGCSNAGEAADYHAYQQALVESFRRTFDRPDLAFVCVQLAGLVAHRPQNPMTDEEIDALPPSDGWFVPIRAEQERIREVPGCEMATAFDIGDPFDIHPKNKQEVARRLAAHAQNLCYGGKEPARGPQIEKLQVKDGAVEIIFTGPVVVKGGAVGPHEFTLFDADMTRHWASATQPWPNVIRVESPAVKRPVQIDYGWLAYVRRGSIGNWSGYPLTPFRRKVSYDGLCYERFRARTWALDAKDLIEIDANGWPTPPKDLRVIARHDFTAAGCGRNGRDPVSDGELGVVFVTDSGYWRYLPDQKKFEPSTKETWEKFHAPEPKPDKFDDRLFFADPFVLYHDGVYYAYGTSAAHGIAVATSKDLRIWKTGVGRAKEGLALHRADSYGRKWFWAPEVYRRKDGKFVMCYSAEQHVCAAVADSPLGPFRQTDKKPMIESHAIDNSIFVDDDGKAWMTYTCWGKPGHGSGPRIIELEEDLLHVKKGAEPVFLFDASQDWEKTVDYGRVNEGPFILKHEGLYYITWSANGYENPRYAVGVGTAKAVTGPWTKNRGNPILVRHGGLYGTGHHSFFRDAEGKLMIAFHAHPSCRRFDPRFMCIASAQFAEKDGEKTIVIGNDVITCRRQLEKKPLGYQLDVSRCKVPTMTMLKTVVETIAKLGYTQFQLYTEHTFAYAKHEEVWREASPLTPAEIRELDAYCAARGIELVPNQNSFGHMEHWLKHPGYNDLAEMPRGGKLREKGRSVSHPSVICPTDPRSEKLIAGLYDELFPCFRSKYVNVGCDETWELDNALGTGRSAAAIAEKGWHRVYLEFLRKVHGLCAARGHTMMFWGDIILHRPELISELPEDVIALNWGYEADHEFEKQTAALQEAERRFIVCPGTSAWGSLFGRTSNMMGNIDNACAAGERHGAFGYLLADWGDGGHPNPWIVSVPALVYLSAKRNEGRALTQTELASRIDRLLGCRVGLALLEMGDVYLTSKGRSWNCAEFFHVLREGPNYKMPSDVTPQTLSAALMTWDKARMQADLKDAPKWVKDDFAMLDLLKEAVAARVKDRTDPSFRARFESRYRALWLRANRIGGLQSSLNQLFGKE